MAMYSPNKKLGQNFLQDAEAIDKMIRELDIAIPVTDQTVVEIGPGLGVLTQQLSELLEPTNSKIHVVEIDERFAGKLEAMFAHDLNINVVHADVLQWLPAFETDDDFKLIGSLPYYITSPILHDIINMKIRPSRVVLLIQHEVAEKVCNYTPDSSYLSSFIQSFYNVEYVKKVSRQAFEPVPNVDGAIITLNKKSNVRITREEISKYETFLHHAYRNPRKMINKAFTEAELIVAKLDGNVRPQNVTTDQWIYAFTVLRSQPSL